MSGATTIVLAFTLMACGPSEQPSASEGRPTASETGATIEPTVTPSGTPSAITSAWTGLDWAVGTTAQGSWWNVSDIVRWGSGYVGVGSSRHGDHASGTETTSPAFFTSADGLHWTLVQEGDPIDEDTATQDEEWFPARIVPVGDTLLAVGHNPWGPSAPKVWRTEDG